MSSAKNKHQAVSDTIIVPVLKVLLHEFGRRSKAPSQPVTLSEHNILAEQRQLGLWDDQEPPEGAKQR
jgi:hypothetical protein